MVERDQVLNKFEYILNIRIEKGEEMTMRYEMKLRWHLERQRQHGN